MKNENRTETIKFRCSLSESNSIKRNANKTGLTVSDYVRARVVKDYRTLRSKKDTRIVECITNQDAELVKIYKLVNSLNETDKKEKILEELDLLREENKRLWEIWL